MKTVNRRNFLQAAGIGLSLPFIETSKSIAKTVDGPLLLCSRGETWGEKVLQPGWDVFKASGDLLDAVEASANVTELDPEDQSVGYGGQPNEDGVVQLDASIMYGPTHNCGSVAALENIKTPSSVARLVMERTDHIYLVGEGAKKFAIMHGFKEENLLTEKSRIDWLKWKENLSDKDDRFPPAGDDYSDERTTGTINILGMDSKGDLAGITTTSGLSWKIPGRIGDSPIIGAGLYVDNEVGAAGATGRGEEVIRTLGSFFVIERMRSGLSPQKACEAACQRIIDINGGAANVDFNDKFVAVNKSGEVGCASILSIGGAGPKLAYYTNRGFKVYEGKFLLK
jgi:N4-(beta-N-acetylglucosaminyl)-L-asparaginase